MSHNTFGHLFRVTTWGESHGPAIGCIVDGCPPGIALATPDIQEYLDKRRPGQSRFTTQRQEPDTRRDPVGRVSRRAMASRSRPARRSRSSSSNVDQRSKDYSDIKDKFRPGHADYTYWKKYGIRDYRGGGRSSARETAARVAAGAIARKVVPGVADPRRARSGRRASRSTARCGTGTPSTPTRSSARMRRARVAWAEYLDRVRKSGSSIGAVIEVVADNVPAGWGAPIYGKLDARARRRHDEHQRRQGRRDRRRHGRGRAHRRGERRRDAHGHRRRSRVFLSNHAGGILGGISTGQPIVCRFAVKPTSSILTPRKTIDRDGNETEIVTKGRHDPCVGIRAVPIGEAMMAIVLADQYLRHRGQCG